MPPEPVSGTTSVAVENASPEPRLFFATIWTRSRRFTSSCTTLYVLAVLPVALQALPSPSQRSHLYAYGDGERMAPDLTWFHGCLLC